MYHSPVKRRRVVADAHMPTTVSCDFETRSVIDLKRHGLHVYAAHPQTDVWCLAYAVDDAEPDIWIKGQPLPPALYALIMDGSVQFRAWNAQFERVIWRSIMGARYGWPILPLDRWHCTMADASAMALPRALEHCAEVLGISEQKDMAAWRLVLRMSRPRRMVNGQPMWWEDADRLNVLYSYCKQDVRTERGIMRATRRLEPSERRIYLLDQTINERGVFLDEPLLRGMRRTVEIGLDRANEAIREASQGAVKGVTDTAGMREFLDVDSVKKSAIRELLEGEQPTAQRIVIEARAEAGRSSVAKIDSALGLRGADGRVRGLLQYYGANTGRWAGRLLQPQNFPRPDIVEPASFLDDLYAGTPESYDRIDLFYAPIRVVASNLRAMIRAEPKHILRVADFAGIEARVLAWCAGQRDLVEAFRSGAKIYEEMAGLIYGVDPKTISKDDPRRQIGKNTVLGCGYGLGPETFRRTVKEQEGVDLEEGVPGRAVDAYRHRYPAIPTLWRQLESAALWAVEEPGRRAMVEPCGVKFVKLGAYLYMVLPSGRVLTYARPRIEDVLMPWNEQKPAVVAECVNNKTRRWEARNYYGGLWTENLVQAVSRDLLAQAALRVEAKGYTIVLSVHDELVSEDAVGHGSLDEFITLMATVPGWAGDCPVGATGYEAERYRK